MIGFIKIFEKPIATQLKAMGFEYLTENINKNQDVYVFEATTDLLKILNSLFVETESIYDNILRFGGG